MGVEEEIGVDGFKKSLGGKGLSDVLTRKREVVASDSCFCLGQLCGWCTIL